MADWARKFFSLENIGLLRQALVIMVPMLFACLFAVMWLKTGRKEEKEKRHRPRDMLKQLLESTETQLQKRGRYEEKKIYLSRMGVNYAMGRTVSPEEFLLIKIVTGIFIAAVSAWSFGVAGGVAGWLTGYFGYDILIRLLNNAANEKMLPDIKCVFDTLKIKTEGGMFLTSAIMECYKNTRHPRLKQALFEMNGELIAKNDIGETIDNFGMKFHNKQIDILCIILKQSMESGKTVEILKDISDHLNDMQQSINLKAKNKMESQTLIIQLLMYVLIMVLCVYGIIVSIGSDMLFY